MQEEEEHYAGTTIPLLSSKTFSKLLMEPISQISDDVMLVKLPIVNLNSMFEAIS